MLICQYIKEAKNDILRLYLMFLMVYIDIKKYEIVIFVDLRNKFSE